MKTALTSLTLAAAALLSGCDLLGIESPEKIAAVKEADGKAIGGACRHASRAIEDCYALNPKAQRAAVFTGWREMDEYMRENKLEGITPQVAKGPAAGKGEAEVEEKPAAKDVAKAGAAKPAAAPAAAKPKT
ncbi:hypothetical protein [Roseateles toxinivorans]|uniref:Uncharacterized protein n=1 Tax=Roseateles toxinivorans TaxID=270368 RepID=A0A4R6QK86_9BURK|nr:hypothetical protein [Roseateles toxinivorans]TDP62239.1 hypothetical protein DES47_10851 [Roseateles toxinivorans]